MTRQLVEDRLQPKELGNPSSYGTIKSIGIAVTGPQLEPGRTVPHAAILYRWKNGEVRLFEMRDHKQLRDEPSRAGFVWVEPAIPPERMRLVINRARLVYRRNQQNGVPYGFRYQCSSFDEHGGLRLGDGEIGFTCATIVAAVLEAERLPLLDPASWPAPDAADLDVRRRYIEHVRKTDGEHARVLEADIQAARISPEEVTAAAAIYPQVGTFDNLQDGAAVVRSRIGT